MPSFKNNLHQYAELTVRVGLNLRPGQRLIINNAATRGVPLPAAPLVREIVRAAYAAGARFVDVIWNDEDLLRARAQGAPKDSFDEYPDWQIRGLLDIVEKGDAMLTIRANNPDLLSDLDPETVNAIQKTHLKRFEPVGRMVSNSAINWCVVAAAAPAWAAKVFPDLTREKAEAKLWKEIFKVTRADQPDPVAAWKKHIKALAARADYLNAKQYTGLKYAGPGTDLKLGLPRNHRWVSARMTAGNGVDFTANIPTEEVFTLGHRTQADGTVRATRPLIYGGALIDDFSLTFEGGRVIRVAARKGQATLQRMIETDDGASRIGEISLVPNSSPISKLKHLFYDTLIDENASCHLALGRAYRFSLVGGETMDDATFTSRGGNLSLTHVDFMMGSGKLNVDGICEDGRSEPVLRKGEWAFDA